MSSPSSPPCCPCSVCSHRHSAGACASTDGSEGNGSRSGASRQPSTGMLMSPGSGTWMHCWLLIGKCVTLPLLRMQLISQTKGDLIGLGRITGTPAHHHLHLTSRVTPRGRDGEDCGSTCTTSTSIPGQQPAESNSSSPSSTGSSRRSPAALVLQWAGLAAELCWLTFFMPKKNEGATQTETNGEEGGGGIRNSPVSLLSSLKAILCSPLTAVRLVQSTELNVKGICLAMLLEALRTLVSEDFGFAVGHSLQQRGLGVLMYAPPASAHRSPHRRGAASAGTNERHSPLWRRCCVRFLQATVKPLLVSLLFHPFEVLTTRLLCDVVARGSLVTMSSCSSGRSYEGIFQCLTKTLTEDGPLALYAGFAASALGIAIYRGGGTVLIDSLVQLEDSLVEEFSQHSRGSSGGRRGEGGDETELVASCRQCGRRGYDDLDYRLSPTPTPSPARNPHASVENDDGSSGDRDGVPAGAAGGTTNRGLVYRFRTAISRSYRRSLYKYIFKHRTARVAIHLGVEALVLYCSYPSDTLRRRAMLNPQSVVLVPDGMLLGRERLQNIALKWVSAIPGGLLSVVVRSRRTGRRGTSPGSSAEGTPAPAPAPAPTTGKCTEPSSTPCLVDGAWLSVLRMLLTRLFACMLDGK